MNIKQEGYTLQQSKEAVGPGWASLIEEVFNKLETFPNFRLIQVKEKFGRLRIYYDYNYTDFSKFESLTPEYKEVESENWRQFDLFLHDIEYRSSKVCEDCGKEGKTIDKRGWLTTLCPECEAKEK